MRIIQTIEIREITTIEELHQLQQVERAVWEMPSIPIHQTFTAMKNGGIILGAYSGEKMVGFLYSFAGFDSNSVYLCSHMLGILPEYRKADLGVKMKLKQAQLAKDKGYDMITWTFDPLESKNAYLNLHKLGAIGAVYRTNHYGDLNDKLNQGLPTDRILIKWDLNKSTKKRENHSLDMGKVLLTADKFGKPIASDVTGTLSSDKWFVAIPRDIQTMKQTDFELAKEWRYQTRKIFKQLFAVGYQATDLLLDTNENFISFYVFTK